MYVPPAFRDDDLDNIRANVRSARLANLVTATADGPLATPLPLFLEETEGERGVLYGHVARANPQWHSPPIGEALAIFMGPDAYVTPSWYATKQENGKVVPTWNYIAVHAYGPVEFFHDPERLLEVVTRLTNIQEKPRAKPWTVDEAPADFVAAQLRGIVGVRIPVTTFKGKRKMSQNRPEADRTRVAAGLTASEDPRDREVGLLISVEGGGRSSN
ncbi:transcriptional regulator [Bradyrhizobium sacchari]|uniref:PaiB family negative transcriptional regulator n=1 Tax=Bradyrhizobium sacchari TaxID=1399419 RepID=A0A560KCA1_9BRAD|nr:FMN-binding negative transcriptional regulator [Bradyrhizobium sacchari]OPY94376.1 transcriptional regulator [Bradyrhizobium sacchari]TWB64503.1 PaiB family negative transcriptional regulator [Bradyrhizobium sacchari]TWB80826.1 PaiB family negative transcriptional regulator [Bradyrhizobium sacchari]